MLLHQLSVCFLLAFLLSFCTETANGDTQKEMSVLAFWKKAVYENYNSEKVLKKVTYVKGMKNLKSDSRTMVAMHNVGVVLGTGDMFKMVKLEVSYSFSHTTTRIAMTEDEIYESHTTEHTVTIPPFSKLTRWQLVVNVAGMQIDCGHYIDVLNDTVPHVISSRATISVGRQILYGSTSFRIKHLERNEYMTVVDRYGWQAATLGHSNLFLFRLCENSRGLRIKALNTKHSGYEWAYSSSNGGIYFDEDRDVYSNWYETWSYDEKQYWLISKAQPIYDGDIVTFKNKYYDDSGLCYYQGPTTNVYCSHACEDKWVLEAV